MESPLYWMQQPLKKYADFTGRARRMEFWMFYIGVIGAYVVASIVDSVIGYPILTAVVALGSLIPNIACGVRRMHDSDHSGWWLLVPIVNLVFLFIDGTRGENRFGPDTKAGVVPAA